MKMTIQTFYNIYYVYIINLGQPNGNWKNRSSVASVAVAGVKGQLRQLEKIFSCRFSCHAQPFIYRGSMNLATKATQKTVNSIKLKNIV